MTIPNPDIDTLERLLFLGDIGDDCPYLSGRSATFRYIDGRLAAPYYRELLDRGYRRAGVLMYRPVCDPCHECKVLRVPVAGFKRTKSQRRAWNKAAPVFSVSVGSPGYTDEKADLYRAYLRYQHDDRAQDLDRDAYTRFLVNSCLGEDTFELRFHHAGRLAALGILDRMPDALSTVYFFFDPALAPVSPGTFSALYEIELARWLGLSWYYLGYYIRDCPSMAYKARFKPCQIMDPK
jgi:arginine-tRNA-protein transferase